MSLDNPKSPSSLFKKHSRCESLACCLYGARTSTISPISQSRLVTFAAIACLLDGELVACDEGGLSVFAMLRRHGTEHRAFLYAFDLLELEGMDLQREPIEAR